MRKVYQNSDEAKAIPGVSPDIQLQSSQFQIDAGGKLLVAERCRFLSAKISIKRGASVSIGAGSVIKGVIIAEANTHVSIGAALICNAAVHIQAAEGADVKIGDGCLFAIASIYSSDMHSILDETGQRINPAAGVEIGNRVWIARGAMILKGANLADDTVVGAGSVVSGNHPGRSVLAGNPAKVVRSGVTWKRERI